jgi:uncharacterized caspase-like protein
MHGFPARAAGSIAGWLAAILVVVAACLPAAAQSEKRIALVIGNSAYQKGNLATAANDAGLIAQTLQAAGFDVVGARDLDGDTLRHAVRDFVQKASASGPDTVAFVYLAGYGLQMTGENYFLPIDANIARDTDLPVEGLRMSDYMHQLANLQLRASIVVLDAARANPFTLAGQPLAGGLALVEPNPNMLVAFNAAPGTVAPEEQGPYGAYAQALAEMIREGGLPLPEVFNRVRLRVNEATKGAEVPWDAQKVQTNFVFFERAPDAPQAAPPDQVAAARTRQIRDFDAKDAYVAALERDSLQGYEEFLTAFPNDPMAARVRAIVAARREAITWRRTYRADTPDAYWSYLKRYPDGPHAADAHRRLSELAAALEPPPSFQMLAYDVPPPPPEEVVYIRRPVLVFDDPVFAFAPPPPPPVFFLPPPPPDFVVLPPPPPPVGVFVLPTPLFVAVPAYVRPPAYVAPPPNNIIYANIHNSTVVNNIIVNKTVVNNVSTTTVNNPTPGAPGGSVAAPNVVRPGIPGVTPAAATVGPSLPPSVAQRASLIQRQNPQGTPPGARPGPTQANVPGAQPGLSPNNRLQPLPGANGQPLPTPTAMPATATPGGPARPGQPGGAAATTTPTGTPPGAVRPAPGAPANGALHPGGTPAATLPPGGKPTPNAVPGTATPAAVLPQRPAGPPPAQNQHRPGPGPALQQKPNTPPPAQAINRPPPPSVTRPTPPPPVTSRPPSPPVVNRPSAPPPQAVNRPPPPAVRQPPPPPVVSRPTSPPVVNRPPPPQMVNRPPPPAARPAPPQKRCVVENGKPVCH